MRRCVVAAALAAAACGGDGATATFNGTVRGEGMVPADSISDPAAVSFSSGVVPVAAIVISDAGSLCTRLGANREPGSARTLTLFLTDVDAATGALKVPVGTGEFPIFVVGSGTPPPHFAVASFAVNDASCRPVAAKSAAAVAGSVTLTGNANGVYRGTYDLLFEGGDRVTGAFQPAPCRGLSDYLATNAHGCG